MPTGMYIQKPSQCRKRRLTMQGKTFTDKHKKGLQGRAPTIGFTGRTHTDKTKEKIGRASFLRWRDPQFRHKATQGGMRTSHLRPTIPELRLIKIIEDYDLPFTYNGNRGNLIVGGLCPDFYSNNGYRCLVEVYGDYWHQNDTKNRKEVYSSYNYKVLILWESEIKTYSDDTIMGFLVDLLSRKEAKNEISYVW